MIRRRFIRVAASALCLAVAPVATSQMPPAAAVSSPTLVDRNKLPTRAEFAELARKDPLGMLTASLSRYRHEVKGYCCTLEKQESVNGGKPAVEVVDLAFRDDPFAVVMKWRGKRGFTDPVATLYVKGENNGNLKVRTSWSELDPSPTGVMAQGSSRFSILDFGIYRGTLRTYAAWKKAADQGILKYEFVETKPIPQLNDRVCHVVRRTCDPPEVDNFSLEDAKVRPADKFPKEAIGQVTLMLDAETFLQVGSVLRRPDGSLLAEYYFRDLKMNPTFGPDQFKPAVLKN